MGGILARYLISAIFAIASTGVFTVIAMQDGENNDPAAGEVAVLEVVEPETTEPEITEVETVEPEITEVEVQEQSDQETEIQNALSGEGGNPTFDIVRVDANGMAVIAGKAEPGSVVSIMSNGVKIAEAIADASGNFVVLVQTPINTESQSLEIEAELDGQIAYSEETIIILPTMTAPSIEETEEVLPVIIRTTAETIEVVQPAVPVMQNQVSLDSISYGEAAEVILKGRGTAGDKIIVYINNQPVGETTISADGVWVVVLDDVDAGQYSLRVDAIGADGKVASRIETPFQRAVIEDVQQAQTDEGRTYTVQPGNSLWIIATSYYGEGVEYMQIFTANRDLIRDPDWIYPGQILAIPSE